MGVSEGSRASERTSGDDGAHPGHRRAASRNWPLALSNFRGGADDVCTTSPLALHIPEKSTTAVLPNRLLLPKLSAANNRRRRWRSSFRLRRRKHFAI